jgi:hypothetical protein
LSNEHFGSQGQSSPASLATTRITAAPAIQVVEEHDCFSLDMDAVYDSGDDGSESDPSVDNVPVTALARSLGPGIKSAAAMLAAIRAAEIKQRARELKAERGALKEAELLKKQQAVAAAKAALDKAGQAVADAEAKRKKRAAAASAGASADASRPRKNYTLTTFKRASPKNIPPPHVPVYRLAETRGKPPVLIQISVLDHSNLGIGKTLEERGVPGQSTGATRGAADRARGRLSVAQAQAQVQQSLPHGQRERPNSAQAFLQEGLARMAQHATLYEALSSPPANLREQQATVGASRGVVTTGLSIGAAALAGPRPSQSWSQGQRGSPPPIFSSGGHNASAGADESATGSMLPVFGTDNTSLASAAPSQFLRPVGRAVARDSL